MTQAGGHAGQILIAGVDEVGRGPLAGPVVTAAVILDPAQPIIGLNDSKKLSEKRRENLAEQIKQQALAWALGRAEVHEIDQLNVLWATMLAMQRAVAALTIQPDECRIDGNRVPELPMPATALIGGDGLHESISAASIIAKVSRDQEMQQLDQHYPGYGLAKHKGYPTKMHIAALQELGVTDIHRRSFAPVSNALATAGLNSSNEK